MTSDRRNFLKKTILGTGVLAAGLSTRANEVDHASPAETNRTTTKSRFNMSGYAAPKLDKVRIGFIGLGNRGPGAVERMSNIEGVEIVALCDIQSERVDKCQAILEKHGLPKARSYSGSKEIWKEMCQSADLDLIYITTPWAWHTPMAVYAMESGKHAASEVPAAKTIDECWQLVETSEKTRKHFMMLENCCYDFFELLTLNMARQGYFGEIIHGEGAYIHDLLEGNFSKSKYSDMWRLKENYREGNIYPTHGLGPICQIMNINRGDQMDFLTSVSSKDFQMSAKASELAATDNFYSEFVGKQFRGNMNTTTIRTMKGRTIMVQHDVTSPRPYSRIHLISGTKGMASKWPEPARISNGHGWLTEIEMKAVEEKYTPEIVKRIGEMAKRIGGHGGMDFMMDWRLIDCLRNGLPLDENVYDAALWSSIAPLSEKSVANRSNSVDIPDFTNGNWKTNAPVELTRKGGGTTEVRNANKSKA
ncbi:MAG: Gfo/Idh/MocA family oxidoreductase [Bacteroidia bacterium]|nr:Gfo/Idh/MocA family oxidoreductase [Bacteroidia bacterium]